MSQDDEKAADFIIEYSIFWKSFIQITLKHYSGNYCNRPRPNPISNNRPSLHFFIFLIFIFFSNVANLLSVPKKKHKKNSYFPMIKNIFFDGCVPNNIFVTIINTVKEINIKEPYAILAPANR